MHGFLFLMVMGAVIVMTALLFVFWLIIVVLRGISRLLLGPGLKPARPAVQKRITTPARTRRCIQENCRALNTAEARFCRRCGHRLDGAPAVAGRRAAML